MRHRTPFSRLSIAADTRISPRHSLGINALDAKAAKHISEALKTNSVIKDLECADTHPLLCCQDADTRNAPLARSLDSNKLEVKGAQIMADLLMTNTTITTLGCAATRPLLYCQC